MNSSKRSKPVTLIIRAGHQNDPNDQTNHRSRTIKVVPLMIKTHPNKAYNRFEIIVKEKHFEKALEKCVYSNVILFQFIHLQCNSYCNILKKHLQLFVIYLKKLNENSIILQ